MIVPASIVQLVQPWNDFYSHSKAAATVVLFLHIGGLLLAGGLGVATDRATIRALRLPAPERGGQLAELHAAHRVVVPGLGIVALSGLALLAADIETFAGSWIFWTKMTLVLVLLVNGYRMTRVERALALDPAEDSPAWKSLGTVALTSLVLWFTITLAGVSLANFA